jgi:hypothetical protein
MRTIVMNSLLFRDKEHYDLHPATIMSNHVHILLSCFQTLRRYYANSDTLIRNDEHFL